MAEHHYSTPVIYLCLSFSSNFSTAEKPIHCYRESFLLNLHVGLWAGLVAPQGSQLLGSKDPSGRRGSASAPDEHPALNSCPVWRSGLWGNEWAQIPLQRESHHQGRLTRFCCSLHWLQKASFYTITEILLKDACLHLNFKTKAVVKLLPNVLV